MNSSPWPRVALGELLTKSEATIEIQPDSDYKQITVRLWGQGVVLRDEMTGAQIREGKRYVAHSGQFILSRIDARNGAFGLVPELLDGAVVSNDFPVFDIDVQRLFPGFLGWLSKTQSFVDFCRVASEGTTNRVRLQVNRFLATEIPLPPLAEQRRIVARIEALAARVEAARELRTKAQEEVNRVMESNLGDIFENLSQEFGTLEIQKFAGVKGGKRLPRGERLIGTPTPFVYIRVSDMENFSVNMANLMYVPDHIHPAIAQYTISSRNVYVTIAGTIGQPGLLPDALDGANLTENAAKLVFDNMKYDKRFVTYALRSPQVQEQFRQRQTKSAQPKLALRTIRTTRVAIPPLSEQHRIVARLDALQAKIAAVQQHQAATQVRLEALLPSILDRAFKGEL